MRPAGERFRLLCLPVRVINLAATYHPGLILISLFVLPLERGLCVCLTGRFEFCGSGLRKYCGQLLGLRVRIDLVAGLLGAVLLDNSQDLMLEEVVEDAVRGGDAHVTVLQGHCVVVSRLGRIRALFRLLQIFAQLLRLRLLSLLHQDSDVSLRR